MSNRGVVYTGAGKVEVQDTPDPKFETPGGRKITHGVILRAVSTNICGLDQHMVRGRTTAPVGSRSMRRLNPIRRSTAAFPTSSSSTRTG